MQMFATQVHYLGHIISARCVEVDPAKVEVASTRESDRG